jgi:hypothetical protein
MPRSSSPEGIARFDAARPAGWRPFLDVQPGRVLGGGNADADDFIEPGDGKVAVASGLRPPFFDGPRLPGCTIT